MKIRRLEIAGFGKLCDLDLGLAPAVNLFFGENEAGKSTLQEAVLTLLYGFYQGDRATKAENERREIYRPWHAARYGGTLEYCLDDGTCFRIERDFGTDDVPTKVINLATGQNVTSEFGVGRHGNVPVARQQLGMSHPVFRSSAFISQGAIAELDTTGALGDTIVGLADTGKRDISAARAIQSLDSAVRQRVGTDRSRTTPFAVSKRRVSEYEEELRKYREAKEAVQNAAAEREELSGQLNECKRDLQRASFSVICREIENVEDRLRTIGQLDQRMDEAKAKRDGLSKYSDFPLGLHEQAIRGRQSLSDAAGRVSELRRALAEKETSLAQVGAISEHQKLSGTIGQLLDTEYRDLQDIRQELIRLAESIEEKRRLLEKLETRRARMKTWVLALAILIPPIGIPLLLWQRARSKRILEQEKKGVRQASDSLQTEQTLATTRLEALLKRYEVESLEELEKKRLRYFQLGSSLAELNSLNKQVGEGQSAVDAERERLLGIFQRAHIQERDFDKASAMFDEAYEGKTRYDHANDDFQAAEKGKSQVQGTESPHELAGRHRNLQQQKDALLATNPELAGLRLDKTLDSLRGECTNLGDRKASLEREIAIRDEKVKAGLSAHREGAEIEEDIARYQREVGRLLLLRRSLEAAITAIEDAAGELHRDFAPRLAEAVGAQVAALTGGRYSTVYVDPAEFNVAVKEPETGQIITADKLSFGTTEQMYFFLRIELARLMSNLHERVPLFLDDPFVNFDQPRLTRALDFLARLSKETQIFLLSKDPDIMRWFSGSLAGHSTCRAFIMAADGSVTAPGKRRLGHKEGT
ncbi:MAG: AAA family ATPase [Chloroflexi bacterium]|nr:AAA family ATPase [Chloroflexota bacterium]